MALNSTTRIDLDVLCSAIDAARADAAGTPWASRIEDAYEWLIERDAVEHTPVGQLVVNSPSGETYFPNGVCGCKAGQRGIPCWHRAARQIVARMLQAQQAQHIARIASARRARIYAEADELYA